MKITKIINLNYLDTIDYSELYLNSSLVYKEELNNLAEYFRLLQEEIQIYIKDDILIQVEIEVNSAIEIKLLTFKQIFPYNLKKDNNNLHFVNKFYIDIKNLKNLPIVSVFNSTFDDNTHEYLEFSIMNSYMIFVKKIDSFFKEKLSIMESLNTEGIYFERRIALSKELFNLDFNYHYLSISSKAYQTETFASSPINTTFFQIKYVPTDKTVNITIKRTTVSFTLQEFLSLDNSELENFIVSSLNLYKIDVKNYDGFIGHLINLEILQY